MAELYREKAWSYFPHWQLYGKMVETSHYLTRSVTVSSFNKMMLHTCAINLLEMEGDFENYFHQEMQVTVAIANDLIAKTYVGSFMLVWQIDIAIAMGEYNRASSLVFQALENNAPPHTYCQYLHYQSLLLALTGDTRNAQIAAENALAIRHELGGKIFIMITELIIGTAFAFLGLRDKAKKMLSKVVEDSTDIGEEFLRAGAYAALAYLHFPTNEKKSSRLCDGLPRMPEKKWVQAFFRLVSGNHATRASICRTSWNRRTICARIIG